MSLELAPALLLPLVALLHRSAGRSERREFGWRDRRRAPLVLPDFLPQRRPALPLENPSCVCDLAMPTVLAMNDDVTTPKPAKVLWVCLHGHEETRTHSTLGRPRATQGKRARRAPAEKLGYAPLLWGPAPACSPLHPTRPREWRALRAPLPTPPREYCVEAGRVGGAALRQTPEHWQSQ